jgi:hypothetical protein
MPSKLSVAAAVLLALTPAVPAPAAAGLEIAGVTLHEYEDGPAIPANWTYRQGEYLFFSFRVRGFQEKKRDRERDVHLTYSFVAEDPDGVPLAEPETGEVKTVLTEKDENWTPKIRGEVFLPTLILSGEYRIRLHVEDKLSGRKADNVIKAPVKTFEVAPSEELVVRNFRFLRGGEDGAPLTVAAYRPGETLWARFEMTGYKYAEGNQLHVSYGLRLSYSDGTVLFDQPDAASEQDASFYPKRYLPGIFNLNLEGGIEPGEYVIELRVKDHIGDQTYTGSYTFRIE